VFAENIFTAEDAEYAENFFFAFNDFLCAPSALCG
jgi:hypothetical protein